MTADSGVVMRKSTMVVLGSGGHTSEMICLIAGLDPTRYSPIIFVTAQLKFTDVEHVRIRRSREVKQSWWSSLFSVLLALFESLWLMFLRRPDLILCNGPGTCVPICYAARLYCWLGLYRPVIVFVESFCRVRSMSLSGRLLYPVADRFLVQWPELLSDRYPRAEFIGKIF